MLSAPVQDMERHQVLEALRKYVASTRIQYDDNLAPEGRRTLLTNADSHIELMNEAFSSLLSDMRRDRNQYAPINHLIDDIMLEVWSYTELPDRYAISQVCHKWRHLAVSSPTMWTLIDLEYNRISRLRELLLRAGLSPLHIVVGAKEIDGQTNYQMEANRGRGSHFQSLVPYNRRSGGAQMSDLLAMFTPEKSFSYESLILTQKGFDELVGRSATLDALVEEAPNYYMTPKSKAFVTPMPNLRTLRLGQGDKHDRRFDSGFRSGHMEEKPQVSADSLPFPLFGKVTPLLRQLCLDHVHIRWDDPIYRNLTNLRIYRPHQRAPIPQLLRILRSCPKLVELQIVECIFPQILQATETSDRKQNTDGIKDVAIGPHPPSVDDIFTVSLPKLQLFHFQDSYNVSSIGFLSKLSIPRLHFLSLETTPDNYGRGQGPSEDRQPCFTNDLNIPLDSLTSTVSQPTQLRICAHPGYLTMEALYHIRDRHNTQQPHLSSSNSNINRYAGPAWSQWRARRKRIMEQKGKSVEDGWWQYRYREKSESGVMDNRLDPTGWKAATIAHGSQDKHWSPISQSNAVLSNAYIGVFENASLGGVQFHTIKMLSIVQGNIWTDTFYRTLFRLCCNVEKLRLDYFQGVGILSAILGDDTGSSEEGPRANEKRYRTLLPMLTEVYLVPSNSNSGNRRMLPPEVLAEWVETRQRMAMEKAKVDVDVDSALEVDGSLRINTAYEYHIQRLKKVVVRFPFASSTNPKLSPETKERIERALGCGESAMGNKSAATLTRDDGMRFVWEEPPSTCLTDERQETINNDIGYTPGDPAEVSKVEGTSGEDTVEQNEGVSEDETHSNVEWIPDGLECGNGWCIGPW